VPLRFDVLGDGVTLSPLILDWDLSAQNNLKISNVEFNDKSFLIGIYQAYKLDPSLNSILDKDAAKEWLMVARWPKPLLKIGNLEALSRSGQVLWHQELKESDFDNWQNQQNDWKLKLRSKKVPASEIAKMPLMQVNVALRKFNEDVQPFWSLTEPFRFCLSTEPEDGFYTRMCTRLIEVVHTIDKDKKDDVSFSAFPRVAQPARIIAFNENAKLKDSQQIKEGLPVQFYAELTSGSTYEFVSKTMTFNMVEMTDIDSKQVRLMAWGPKPNIPVREIKDDRRGWLEKILGPPWAPTIGDFREFWDVNIPRDKPSLYISGKGGGLFREEFTITKLPNEKIRPYVNDTTIIDTYVDGPKIYGKGARGTKVSSTQNSSEMDDEKTNEFIWKFGAKERGDYDRSYLLVNDGKDTYRAYREIYKGYPGEISARLTGILTSGGYTLFLGELTGNYWFESLLGWNNYYLSRQRWGISLKYFQSLNTLTTGTITDTLQYSTGALKYRLDPGLWSRDETWGVEAGVNQVSYNIFQVQLLGGGVFWARSMPKVFDDIMNILPVFRFPKWVDLEFLYYPVTQTAGVIPNNFGQGYGNWELNFHGKVMWTKQFFGEAGFGIKQLDFLESVNQTTVTKLRLQFTSFYGTAGLGWSF
jgi:hypothetical protein